MQQEKLTELLTGIGNGQMLTEDSPDVSLIPIGASAGQSETIFMATQWHHYFLSFYSRKKPGKPKRIHGHLLRGKTPSPLSRNSGPDGKKAEVFLQAIPTFQLPGKNKRGEHHGLLHSHFP